MMKSYKPSQLYRYILSDLAASIITWWIFTWYSRNKLHESHTGLLEMIHDAFFQASVIVIPIVWVCFFLIAGFYRQSLYKRSRLNELTSTFIACLIGCLLIFFSVILNDRAPAYTYFYNTFSLFFSLQFLLTATGRLLLLTRAKADLIAGKIKINTIIIGNGSNAVKIFRELQKPRQSDAFSLIGYVNTNNSKSVLGKWIQALGALDNLADIIKHHSIKQVIIALEKDENDLTENLLQRLSEADVEIKLFPNTLEAV